MTIKYRSARAMCFVALVCAAISSTAAAAPEDVVSPPVPLEFPFEAKPDTLRGVNMQVFRSFVQEGANFGLCKALMTKDGRAMPRDAASKEYCPPNYAQKVTANEGFIRWASGARPLQCNGCVGRPFMTAENNQAAPNLRRAMLYGRLKFVSTTGPNRTITYPLEAYFTCRAKNGAREGKLALDIKFSPPVVGDPGFWESVASFFTARALSDFIDAKIKENLQDIPSLQNVPLGAGEKLPCLSLGVERGQDPRFDVVKFDLPASSAGPAGSKGVLSVTGPIKSVTGALKDMATVRLLSVKRLPLPPLVAPEHARPGDPTAGQFTLYVNGVIAKLPPTGLALPPEGGVAPLNFCKTVDMPGRKTLQVLFTNDLGGAVWSQFERGANLGAGIVRKMTTGRSIVAPALSGPPNPVTGKPTVGKPRTVVLREFELTYDIAFSQLPAVSVLPAVPVEKPPANISGVNLNVGGAAINPAQPFTVDPAGSAPSQPCRPL